MRKYLPLLSLLVFAASCKHRQPKDIIVGKWRSVEVRNKDKDNFFAASKLFIDTMGNNNSDEANFEIYGVTNIDSLRSELRIQFDSAYAAQMNIDTQSVFTFKDDNTVVLSFPGKSESGKWKIDEENNLILEETNSMGQTDKMNVKITSLAEDKLTLSFIREIEKNIFDTSVVIFSRQE